MVDALVDDEHLPAVAVVTVDGEDVSATEFDLHVED